MVPISINKDVFEPRYNNLKFRAQNYNYFSSNLIHNKALKIQRTKFTRTCL